MLIKDRMTEYLSQEMSWERVQQNDEGKTLYDENGNAKYSVPVSIKGRKIGKYSKKIDSKGAEIVCDTFVITYADIMAEDKLDGKQVVSVKEIVDKYGEKVGVECYL